MRLYGRIGGVVWLLLAMFLCSVPDVQARVVEEGVSRSLAVDRAARVKDVRYSLRFTLVPRSPTVEGVETLTFSDAGSGDLALDYRDGSVSSASLNGKEISTGIENGHLNLPGAALVKGNNKLVLEFASNVAAAGKAITRYEDRDDHSEYVYTLFVPMDASMAFPCFDQPDLKARFKLTILHPSDWKVVANTAPSLVDSGGKKGETSFPETLPISTYLFAFAAGPFEALPGKTAGEPTVYVRKSQLARAKVEAPQVQQMAARGIRYLSNYFAQPFPFAKYDLVLIPGFPFGGMEHAGATFLNEDGVLFRTAPTESDYFRRNILVLHETCHQWFGDLVTMRWFDDLWLKEGFAQYMAYKALATVEPAENPWKHFYEDIKPLAYGIDETQGTTPIFQNIVNLKDAKSAYGAIVYQKAPAVLKELDYFLGEKNFRDGLRLYLKEHAYGNAQWADLIRAFERTGNKDVQQWAKAWILQRGMPQVSVSVACAGGKISELKLRQEDVLHQGYTWPISNEVLMEDGAGGVSNVRVDWSAKETEVREAVGRKCPQTVFANHGDFGYGRFLLDAASETAVSKSALAPGANGVDPLLRSMLWGALWENVHIAQTAPPRYVDLALKALPVEADESLARIQGARIATALHAYMTERGRTVYASRIEGIAADRMLNGATLNLRVVNFRTFTNVAETPAALGQMKSLLDGSVRVPGMPLKPLDRWNLIGHLVAMRDPDAAALFDREKAKDQSGEGQKYAYAVEAGAPDAAVKARYFEEYVHSADRQEDWITQSLRPFNSWNQTALTAPYLGRALDALAEIKRRRKIFFLGAWLGAFIEGQHSPEAKAIVHDWLAQAQIDPDLRLKVLEASDALDRTVMIRAKFPD